MNCFSLHKEKGTDAAVSGVLSLHESIVMTQKQMLSTYQQLSDDLWIF